MDHDKRKLYLVRHAESVWNAERKVQGTCPGILLSELGREQARLLGNRLRAIEAAVYCSDAERAVETARLALGNGRDMTLMEELRELSLGEWEGRSYCLPGQTGFVRRDARCDAARWVRGGFSWKRARTG